MVNNQIQIQRIFENVTVSSDPNQASVDAKIEGFDGNYVPNLHINILKIITKPTVSIEYE